MSVFTNCRRRTTSGCLWCARYWTYLELLGYLEGGTPFYAKYQFQPLKPSQEILSSFEGERRQFLANVFRQSQKQRKHGSRSTWIKPPRPLAPGGIASCGR